MAEQKLAVHEELLRTTSPFFVASLKKEWIEGKERIIPLPDDEMDIVELYVQWLYRNKIYTRKPKEHLAKESDEYDTLIEAFIFGEKMEDDCFKDTIIDAIIACSVTEDVTGKCRNPIGPRVDRAYDGTPPGSSLRRLLLDIHLQRGHEGWVNETQNAEFLRALTKALYNIRPQQTASAPLNGRGSSCIYHHHGDNPCYSQKYAHNV